ncbi:MAG TPA: undecaprenyl-phosphate glucose phosphotransferase [Chitinophagales bacterium]|nr:undecaprenyl-phosphate glucose phosphotransferase [Chitinophagales bacterium]HMV02130.1 undecaprenyl-phosphate glucose phosphotransferase [Chitinophagales bacterium]HMW93930.1 undecaprenyl-phosphate glucose phosphotransferase [Chitinophagales bacterium]HMY42668.1 undecaprenyl-phosphate glucose phosphotransferase [Chitinophagales bacterium]HMZ68668.1 undecaprenyl-phosphate glucose phosphotransferase [Chitinophagales bacterium]
MRKRQTSIFILAHSIGDIVILNLSIILGHIWSFWGKPIQIFSEMYLQMWLYLNLIYFVSAQISGTFDMYRNTRFFTLVSSIFRLFFFQVVFAFSYIVIFKDFNNTFKLSREALLVTYLSSFILTLIWRFGFIKMARFYRARGFNNRRIVIVGAGESAQDFKKMLESRVEYGYKFIGFFEDRPERYNLKVRENILGSIDEVNAYALNNDIDEIFCALPYSEEIKIKDLISFGDENLIRVKIVPDMTRFLSHHLNKIEIDYYGQIPVMTLRPEPLENFINRVIKRIFDIGFSVLIITFVLSWLIPIISLIIKLTSKGPVFFKQKRSGFRNQTFDVIKFRTMYVHDDSNAKQATKGDSRITPIGAFLRKTSLDEFPQFINVFFGQMSVIGPRPHMLKHTDEYSKIIDKFMVRHLVKPGITGWAQVNGYRGETRNKQKMEDRVRADVWYIENWSFTLDIKIVFMTIVNLIRGEENAF